jgi:nicotinate-nucleotide adenylyltransferase
MEDNKIRVGIFGGAFDPVHLGHLITAQSVKEIRKLDKIIFIPAYISPLKTDYEHTSSIHRLKMLQLAAEQDENFIVDDFEIKNKEVSYTIETLQYLKGKYQKLELIIGYDNLLLFEKWKSPDEILNLADLVILKRKVSLEEKENKFFKAAEFVETPLIEISSTEIRRRVSQGMPINFLVPQKVKEYIYAFNLYKDNN